MLMASFRAGLSVYALTGVLVSGSLLLGAALPQGAQIAYVVRAEPIRINLIDVDRLLSAELTNMMSDAATGAALPTWSPVWSPDGERLAFVSLSEQVVGLYIMDDIGAAHVLTLNPFDAAPPVWSPDGEHLAFTLSEDGMPIIYSADADGGELNQLTNGSDWSPVWSPSGVDLAFLSYRDGNGDIYVMRIDDTADGQFPGENALRLTDDAATDANPVWSPDGTRLAFVSVRDGNQEIYLVDGPSRRAADAARGNLPSTPINLTRNPSNDWGPVWSPDGTRIAFESWRDNNRDIYVINVSASSGAAQRIASEYDDMQPAWSPDGHQIAFVSWHSGRSDIYVVDVDAALSGSAAPRRLTNSPYEDQSPTWRP